MKHFVFHYSMDPPLFGIKEKHMNDLSLHLFLIITC